LRVIAFAGGWNLPLWAAQRRASSSSRGSRCSSRTRRDRARSVDALMKGRHDIALAAIDNWSPTRRARATGRRSRTPTWSR
jgi:hypothetical protein